MKTYKIQCRETGTEIESGFKTKQEAEFQLALFENSDHSENIFVANFYEIVEE